MITRDVEVNIMKKFQTTLFVIAMLIISTQTMKHIYVKWIEPRTSVLDNFRDTTETAIASSQNIKELETLYAEAYHKVNEYEADKANPVIETRMRRNVEPYKSQTSIRQAIVTLEMRQKRIFEIKFFWACGLISVIAGALIYGRVNRWLGMSAVLIGFTEMIVWTSPLWRGYGLTVSLFERLLNYKLLLSLTSWLLLITFWLLIEKGNLLISRQNNPDNQASGSA
jgi:hypothetical protein